MVASGFSWVVVAASFFAAWAKGMARHVTINKTAILLMEFIAVSLLIVSRLNVAE
jgi:hypothetical protein